MDSLSLLGNCLKEGKSVYLDNSDEKQLVVGDMKFPLEEEVTFKGKKYKLGQIWFFLKNHHKKRSEYSIACKREGFESVDFIDQKNLVEFLVPKGVDITSLLDQKRDEKVKRGEKKQKREMNLQAESSNKKQRIDESRQTTSSSMSESQSASPSKGTLSSENSIDSKSKSSKSEDQSQYIHLHKNKELTKEEQEKEMKKMREIFAQYIDKVSKLKLNEMEKLDPSNFEKLLSFDRKHLDTLKRREIPLVQKIYATKYRSNNKSISFESVLSLMQDVKKDEQKRKQQEQQSKKEEHRNRSNLVQKPLQQQQQQQQQERYDETTFYKHYLGEEIHQIDTTGSNIMGGFGLTSNDSQTSSAAESQEITAKEVDVQNTSGNTDQNSQNIQKLRQSATDHHKRHKKHKNYHIIILPPSLSSLLTLYNVRDLLEKGEFVSTEKKKAENPKVEKWVLLRKQRDQGQIEEYKVVDNSSKLSKEDWKRVVAIFTNGQAWEFKGWFSENPTEIFKKYKGFHLAYDDTQLNPNVEKWPIKILRIGRNENKRHIDNTVVKEIWESISPL